MFRYGLLIRIIDDFFPCRIRMGMCEQEEEEEEMEAEEEEEFGNVLGKELGNVLDP